MTALSRRRDHSGIPRSAESLAAQMTVDIYRRHPVLLLLQPALDRTSNRRSAELLQGAATSSASANVRGAGAGRARLDDDDDDALQASPAWTVQVAGYATQGKPQG